jgi:hypothetical protein
LVDTTGLESGQFAMVDLGFGGGFATGFTRNEFDVIPLSAVVGG